MLPASQAGMHDDDDDKAISSVGSFVGLQCYANTPWAIFRLIESFRRTSATAKIHPQTSGFAGLQREFRMDQDNKKRWAARRSAHNFSHHRAANSFANRRHPL